MKKLLFALLGIVILLVAAVLIGPNLIDLRPRIASAVRDATGRELRIDGDLHVALLPRLRVTASGIHFSNAPGATTPEMLSVDSLALEAELWPLLSERLVVDTLTITHPIANLEVDKAGHPNWAFAPAGKLEAAPAKGTPAAQGGSALGAVQLRDFKLEQGQFSYRDDTTGQTIDAKDVMLTAAMAERYSPATFRGRMTLNDEPVAADFSIDTPEKLSDGQQATLNLALNSKHITAKFDGAAQQRPVPGLNGVFDLNIPSVGTLAAWLKRPLGVKQPDPGPLKLHAVLASDGAKLALKDAAITGKAINATAQATFDGSQKPATFDAKIDVQQADLNAYLPPQAEKPVAAKPEPQQQQASGWSTERLELAPLGEANGKAEVTLAAIRYRDLEITKGDINLTLADRVLKIAVEKLALAQGTIDSTTTLDASGDGAKLASHTVIARVQARPLLKTFAGSDRVGGTVEFETAVTGSGESQKELISSLDGTGHFKITDGAIYGINLAATLRKVGSIGFGGSESEKTDFAELSGSYTIKSGVIDNRDMKMLAPVLRLTGSGTVPLPPQTVDYAVEAKLVASLEGQGGKDALAGLPIPIKITGSWGSPNYQVDWSSVFKTIALDPERLKSMPGDLSKAAKDLGVSLPVSGNLGSGTSLPDVMKQVPGMAPAPNAAPAGAGDAQKRPPGSPFDLPSGLLGK